ncbi:MAG: glycosyltransferase family 39 protein [Deltaproteobacteria bacterium]|nr:glycosyltransferase family 39 protein [Deltaproteobacteria bacterium]
MSPLHLNRIVIPSLLLAVLMILCVSSIREKSITYDETAHLPAGYSYWKTGNFKLNVEHPPLVKLIAAIPLLFMDLRFSTDHPSWQANDVFAFGRWFLFEANGGKIDAVLFRSRVPVMVLSMAAGLLVWLWARRLWGEKAAHLALLLYVLEPNIIAHSRLVTTDVPVCLFSLSTMYGLWRFLERPSPAGVAWTGCSLGLALATKYSGLFLLPMMIVLMWLWWGSSREFRFPSGLPALRICRGGAIRGKGLRLTACFALIVIVALAVLWASYGFEFKPLASNPEVIRRLDEVIADPTQPGWKRVISRVARSVPIPAGTYIKGFVHLANHSRTGHPAYLMGQYSKEGWWSYFPLTVLIKTPPALLALCLLSFVFRGRGRSRHWTDEAFLLVPVGIWLIFSLPGRINIGHRHILPIYPFLFVWAARWMTFRPGPKRFLPVLAAVLVAWTAVSSLSVYPHFLAYFSEAVGGPPQGPKYLLDSNIDWGQDIRLLGKYLRQKGWGPVYYDCFGTSPPDLYGIQTLPVGDIQARMPHPGIYAISVNRLFALHHEDKYRYAWLRAQQPLQYIGFSIYIYRIPSTALLAGALTKEDFQ